MIRSIFFDLGGTIVPFDFNLGYAAMAARCGLVPEEIRRRVEKTDLFARFEVGRIEPHRFVDELCGLLELSIGFEEFLDLWGVIFLPYTLVPDALVESLASRYRLYSLSNTNALHFPMVLRDYPVLGRLHGHVLSYEVGAMKPDRRIYEAALARAGSRAEECLFIDDLEVNVKAARECGIDAIHFQSATQLQAELEQRGVQL